MHAHERLSVGLELAPRTDNRLPTGPSSAEQTGGQGQENGTVSYRNKTYVAFASEDINYYRLMEAWRDNENIDFNFYDAHDLYISRDTSKPETIKRNLRERLKNAKQIVLLGSSNRLFGGDAQELDRRIDQALSDTTPIGSVDKPGKKVRYSIGTVAPVTEAGRRLFFIAYTYMNDHNEARGTMDGVWRSLVNLWEAVLKYGNGAAVSIPVIGGGLARIAQILPSQDSIRFIVLSFMLAPRNEKVCDELRIIVRLQDYARLDRLELQSFLASLRPS